MDQLTHILHWFSGGDVQYHNLRMCMMGDRLWITITVALDAAVALGYVLIAYHWWKNQKTLGRGPARTALGTMCNIFVFCGLCGYLFIPLKLVWPAWRLYDCTLAVLVYFTWRYALSTRHLRVIYSELGRSTQLAEDLEKSQQENRRKGFFLNALSHDLRTPLNAISLQAGLLQMRAESGEETALHETIESINANARAAADLLDQLLDYSRLSQNPDQNHLQDVKLKDVLGGCADAFKVGAGAKNLRLQLDCPADLHCTSDALKLDRILKNLISNAIKFTDAGQITLAASGGGESVEIVVSDTGRGIAPEHQEHLFDDFYQVENSERDRKKGFGLGLAIARQLARQLGGDITCASAPGAGSRFCVRLPRALLAKFPEQHAHATRLSLQPQSLQGAPAGG